MFIIGIGGGTGSGKTTVAKKIAEYIGEDICGILPMDNYYRDMSHIPLEERRKYNYDHPDMIEHTLLLEHLKQLREGKTIKLPEYDFATYTRTGNFIEFQPYPVVLVEGIFALYYPELRDMYDLAVYVDTENDVRFIRRLERDIKERGRTLDSVVNQYLNTVKPMHDAYVEPTKKYADIIIPRGGFNEKAIRVIVEYIFRKMGKEK
ncbi:MAG: uridine kinase [Dictyoglomi bacterium]|jgi:uridine kinase|nr:uridine kinase [Dictyoglomota bacterium]